MNALTDKCARWALAMLLLPLLACNMLNEPDTSGGLKTAVAQTLSARTPAAAPATEALPSSTPVLAQSDMLIATPTLPEGITATATQLIFAFATISMQPPTSVPIQRPTQSLVPTLAVPLPDSNSAPLLRANQVLLSATTAANAPTIDGFLTEWESLPLLANHVVFGWNNWQGAADAQAQIGLQWDSTYLYIAVAVQDDVFAQSQTGETLWKGDSLEMQFDSDLAGDFYQNSLSGDDYQLGFSPGNPDLGLPSEVYRWHPKGQSGTLTNVALASQRTATGYQLEIALPWSAIGVNFPQRGQRFGMALNYSDDDDTQIAEQQSMVSVVSSRQWQDPSSWAVLELR
jgi:hypothetical protein